jgi:hypothetical protein
MASAGVWWAQTSAMSIGTNGVTYNWSNDTLGGRVTGVDLNQFGTFLVTLDYWMPRANFPAGGCTFRSTPDAHLSGDAFVGTLVGQTFGLVETAAPRAKCLLRATQEVFAGPSLIASQTNSQDIASVVGDFQTATGHLPTQPFPTVDFDLDRSQDLAVRLRLGFENSIAYSYQTWWGFPAICKIKINQWDIVSIA